jgi:hypothetical protein
MPRPAQRHLLSVVTVFFVGAGVTAAFAQDAPVLPPPAPDAQPDAAPAPGLNGDDQFETLNRGPVHEAFAEQYNADPVEGLTVPKPPPEIIDELPPDQMPEGNNVEWIPGYWGWDDEREDYIWISGLWRDIPPGQRWVPGYWTEAPGGHQWVAGFWTSEETTEFDYIAEAPPASLEQGPNVEAPSDEHFWVPGSWQYADTGYRWRPGYFAPAYDDWVWVPDRFVWTPYGYIFCPGYYDYRLPVRGVMFAPVYFHHPHWWHHHHHHYTPSLVLDVGPLTMHWFVRPSYCHYYFGDYYAVNYYHSWGVQPWYSCQFGFGGFGGFHHHHHVHYDPLLVFYSGYHHRHHHIDYHDRLHRWHRHYHDHEDHRPRHTRREQEEFIARHEHGDEREREIVKNARLSRKLDEYVAQPRGNDQRFVKLDDAERDRRGKKSKEIIDFADLRRDAEVGDTVVRNNRSNGSRDRNNDRTGTDNVADVTIPGATGDNPAPGADDNSRKSRKLRLPEVERNADRTRDARNVTGAPVDPPGGGNSDTTTDDRSRVTRRSNNNRNNSPDGTPTVDSGTPDSVQPDRTTRDSRNRTSREFDANSGSGNRNSRENQSGNNSVPEIVPGTSQPGSSGANDNAGSNRNTRRQQRDMSSGPSYQPVPDSGNVPRSNNSNDGSRNRSNRSGNNNQSNSGSFDFNQGSSNSNRSFDSSRNSNRSSNNGSFNSGSRSNQSNNGSFNSGSRPGNRSSNSGMSNQNQSNRSSNSGSRSGNSGRKRDR